MQSVSQSVSQSVGWLVIGAVAFLILEIRFNPSSGNLDPTCVSSAVPVGES
jgi:hypothetical protein